MEESDESMQRLLSKERRRNEELLATLESMQNAQSSLKQEQARQTREQESVMQEALETISKLNVAPQDNLAGATQSLLVSNILAGAGIKMYQPTRDQIIEQQRQEVLASMPDGRREDNRSRQVSAKIVSRIQKYSGTDEKYTWNAFKCALSIAAGNENYDDKEMRHIFLSSMEGRALEHYQAHMDEYSSFNYEQLERKFAERFAPNQAIGVSGLVGITQGTDEDVRSFMDRIIIAARPLQPLLPNKYAVATINAQGQMIPNPNYPAQKLAYDTIIHQNEKYQITFFLQGLKPEIKMQMRSGVCNSMEEVGRAAAEAEEHMRVTGMTQVLNHLHVTSTEQQVNFVKKEESPLQQMDNSDGVRARPPAPSLVG